MALAALLAPAAATATNYRWASPTSGSWNAAANWLPAGVPASGADSAYVPLAGAAFEIALDMSPSLRGCLLENPTTAVVLNGFNFGAAGTLNNRGVILANAGVTSTLWGGIDNGSGGEVRVDGGAVLQMSGSLWRDDGVISVGAPGAALATLRVVSHLTVSGAGGIVLQDTAAALVESPWGYGFVNAAGHAIRGAGTVSAPLYNHGLVEADRAGCWLKLTTQGVLSDGTLRASGGGVLRIESINVDNTNGEVVADGGLVLLRDVTLANGSLAGVGGGAVATAGTVTLANVATAGRVEIRGGSVAQFGGSSLANAGEILVYDGGGAPAALRMSGHVTAAGAGSLVLQDTTGALLDSPWGYGLVIAADQTLRGAGSVAAPITNHGLIKADRSGQWLRFATFGLVNDGVLQAVDGGVLRIDGISTTNTNGEVRADGGPVELRSATVVGGELAAAPGLAVTAFGTTLLANLRSSGRLEVGSGALVQLGGSTLVNDGVLVVHTGGAASTLRMAGHVTVSGGGAIELADTSRATLDSPSGYALVNATGHTLHGAGTVSLPLYNHGTLVADRPGQWLLLTGPGTQNDGLLRAGPGAKLRIEGISVDNANGAVVADAGMGRLKDAAVVGGTLDGTNGGVVLVTGTTSLGNLRNAGRLEVGAGAVAQLIGSVLTNDGTLTVGGAAAAATLRLAGHITLSGSGAVVLADSARAAFDSPWGYGLVNAAGHTIRGTGVLSAPLTNRGVVRADQAGQRLRLTTHGKINEGLCEADDGGLLRFEVVPANYEAGYRRLTGGRWRAGAGSAVQLPGCPVDSNAADIELDGAGSELLAGAPGVSALAGFVRNARAGRFALRGGRDFSTAGSFANGGELVLGPGSTFTVVGAQLTLGAGGTVRVELSGPPPDGHGVLAVPGHVQVDGAFVAQVVDGFVPALDDTFVVMTFGSRDGEFDPALPYSIGGGRFLRREWRPNSLVLRVVGPAGVDDEPVVAPPPDLRFAARRSGDGEPTLALSLPAAAGVEIAVYDLAGRRLAVLARGEETAGVHEYVWDARAASGARVASGVYVARARVAQGGRTVTLNAKLVVVR